MTLFEDAVLAERRRRGADALADQEYITLIAAGEPIGKPGGLDQTYPFIPHPLYYWLSGARRPGAVLVFDKHAGWLDFVRPASDEERLWEGEPEVPPGRDVAELEAYLATRAGLPVAGLGSPLAGLVADAESSRPLFCPCHCRRDKKPSAL